MLCLNNFRAIDFNSKYNIGEKMGKIYYIFLILFVCLIFNSCAEIDRSSESVNTSLTEQIRSSAYEILIGTEMMTSGNLFVPEQNFTEKSGNSIYKNKNIFIVKQKSSGGREWIVDLGISDQESGISMTFDSSDNVYITGYTRNGLEGNENSGDFTVFLVKYNSSGIREWIKKLGKSEVEYGARLIVDSSDNIYVTGFSSEFELDNEFGPRNTLMTKYDTSGNKEWTKVLEAKMARRQSDVLYMMWPIGKWIGPCEGCFDSHPLQQHERVIAPDQVEFLLGELKSWMATTSIDSDHANSELAMWRKVLEGGGDAATQFSLSQSSRFIMHGVEQGREARDVYHTVTHELYHAFQHDISSDGECHHGSRMMVEAGADYFAYVALENKYPDYGVGGLLRDAWRSYQDEGELAIRGSSVAAGALLRLLVERGHASHEAVMDGSFFHACARGNELGSDTPAMQQALQDWFRIEAHAGSYRFDPAVVSNA